MRRLRLRWRLAVSHAALAIVLVAFAGNRIQAQSHLATTATARATAERDADVLAAGAARVFSDRAALTDLVDDQQGASIHAEIASTDGRLVAGTDLVTGGLATTIAKRAALDGVPAVASDSADVVFAAAPIIVNSATIGVAVVAERVPGHVPTLVSFGVSSWLGMLVITLAAVAGWFLASFLARPIASLTDHVRQLALGADVPVTARGALPEVDTLSAAVHGIADRQRRRQEIDSDQRTALRSLSRRLSHQLRTPLTVLRLRLDALADPSLEPARREILIGVVADQIDRLDVLGEELAILDPARWDLHRERLDLTMLVRGIVLRNAPLARWGGIHLNLNEHAGDSSIVLADEGLIDDAVTNVVQNAIKYTPRGGRIEVTVARQSDELTVTVSDTGPGIRPAERAHVQQAGVRGSTRGTEPGTGHGLSLVADALQRHGGRVDLDETPTGGTTIRLVLPVVDERQT